MIRDFLNFVSVFEMDNFRTENPEETGHTLNGKDVVDEGNWKKDLMYLWITGCIKMILNSMS